MREEARGGRMRRGKVREIQEGKEGWEEESKQG